jgi:uncharacterized protein YcaQ
MQRARENAGDGKGKLHLLRKEKPKYIDAVLREIADRGPLAASELSNGGERRGAWWGWNDGKLAVEWLFFAGLGHHGDAARHVRARLRPHRARAAGHIVALPTPDRRGSAARALRLSAQALGVATEFDLRDYFRLGVADTKARLAELVEAGDLLAVEVEGWDRPAYLHPAARQPRKVEARALLAPFDPLIWERDRTHRIFDFFYRIGIYTPVAKRTHGYYVLPFLLGDRWWPASISRPTAPIPKLLVHAAHLEDGQDAGQVAGPLREELRLMADWLGLESVSLPRAGALAKAMGGCDKARSTLG